MEFQIRPALPADAAALVDGNVRLAQETEGLRLDPAVVAAGVEAFLRHPERGRYLVAEATGRVVGQLAITLEWSDWWNGWYWWIQSVYVQADWRGRGVLSTLFQEVVRQARAEGDVAAIRLYMEEHNQQARAAYLKLGMKFSGYQVLELVTRAA